jgi:hypothetical protein
MEQTFQSPSVAKGICWDMQLRQLQKEAVSEVLGHCKGLGLVHSRMLLYFLELTICSSTGWHGKSPQGKLGGHLTIKKTKTTTTSQQSMSIKVKWVLSINKGCAGRRGRVKEVIDMIGYTIF